MNNQPKIKQGYYLNYKNKVYRLLDFAIKDDDTRQRMLIYQPQYSTPEFGKELLWAKSVDSFFIDIKHPNIEDEMIPRFKYLGMSEEEVRRELKKNKLRIKPEFKNKSILNNGIASLVHGHYAIQAFAKDSDAENLFTAENQIIYCKNGSSAFFILPEKEFIKEAKLDLHNISDAKYIAEINAYINKMNKNE